MSSEDHLRSVTVYCGSSFGTRKAYQLAAISLGKALVQAGRPLIYGGTSKGIMGIVSGAVRAAGGGVTGVTPYAMVAAGGEGEKAKGSSLVKGGAIVELEESTGEIKGKNETIVVDSMHERKVVMATRSCAFVGLPGGYGTYEELLEVTTWTQLGIHRKPVVVLNVLGFFDGLRTLIRSGVDSGFIHPDNENLIIFVDGPDREPSAHENFDWGAAALAAIDGWKPNDAVAYKFDWSLKMPAKEEETERHDNVDAT